MGIKQCKNSEMSHIHVLIIGNY